MSITDQRGVSPSTDSPTHQIRPVAASRSRHRSNDSNQNRGVTRGVEDATGTGGGDYKGFYEDEEEEEDAVDIDLEYRQEYSNNTPSTTRSSRPTANSRRYHQPQTSSQSQAQAHVHGTIREEENPHSSQPQPPPIRTAVHEYYAANGNGYHTMAIPSSSQHPHAHRASPDNGPNNRSYTDRSYNDRSPYADNNPFSDGQPYVGISRQDSDMSPNRGIIMSTPYDYLNNHPGGSNSQHMQPQMFGENVRENSIHSLDADGMVQWYQGNNYLPSLMALVVSSNPIGITVKSSYLLR